MFSCLSVSHIFFMFFCLTDFPSLSVSVHLIVCFMSGFICLIVFHALRLYFACGLSVCLFVVSVTLSQFPSISLPCLSCTFSLSLSYLPHSLTHTFSLSLWLSISLCLFLIFTSFSLSPSLSLPVSRPPSHWRPTHGLVWMCSWMRVTQTLVLHVCVFSPPCS